MTEQNVTGTGAAGTPVAQPAYRWKLLRAGDLWLDGGSMFGVVPRTIWSRGIPYDDQGRILLGHNCLLLERADALPRDAEPAPRRILIETGSGNKSGPKMRKIFGLTDRWIADALAEVGTRCEDIECVIVSHLHFDHAGGLTRLALEGELPDWTPPLAMPEAPARVKLTFPAAPIIVQRREWEDAIANRSVMTRTYLPENLDLIADRVRLVDSPLPFPTGYLPQREEMPLTPVSARGTEVPPGIQLFMIPGHTWGQQAIRFTDDRGRTVVFSADLIPTAHHLGAAYNMAYDVEPFTSTVTRRWFLEAAVEGDWLLVLDHEADQPCQRVLRDGKGWFTLAPDAP